jgi:uncharacterized protein (TIGR02265 family)
MADSFTLPDTAAPLDLEERLAKVPATAMGKGMFVQSVADAAKAVSGVAPGRGHWVAFKDYPVRELLPILVECGRVVHPRVSPREGIRRLGQSAYPTFAGSTIGRVVLSIGGNNLVAALRQAPRAYAVSTTGTTLEIGSLDEGRAILKLRGAWDFPDSWHVGVFEGVLREFKKDGTVRLHTLSLCDVDFELTWK